MAGAKRNRQLQTVQDLYAVKEDQVGRELAQLRKAHESAVTKLNELKEMTDEYRPDDQSHGAQGIGAIKLERRFHGELMGAQAIQERVVDEHHLRARDALARYVTAHQRVDALRRLIEKREREHKKRVFKKIERAQVLRTPTKL